MFAIFSLIIAAASAFGALATNIWVRSQIRELGTKTSPDAGTSGETVSIPCEKHYTSQEIDNLLMAVTRGSHVNITNKSLNSRDSRGIGLTHLNSQKKKVFRTVFLARIAALFYRICHGRVEVGGNRKNRT